MAMTFGSFVSREDAGYSDGDPTVEINDAGAYKLDGIQEDIGIVQQEMIEHENAEAVIDEMKEELEQAAVNYADAAGMDKPSEVKIDGETVVEVDGGTESEIETDGASDSEVEEQVVEKTTELEVNVENLMGKLLKKRSADGKAIFNIYTKKTKLDLQAIRANPLDAYSNSIEELGETIKAAGKRLKDWLMKIWESIRSNLAKIIPFFKNFREKGEAMVKAAKDIKRPELKNDEKGDWSERFIFMRLWSKGSADTIKDFMNRNNPSSQLQGVESIISTIERANKGSGDTDWSSINENMITMINSLPVISSFKDLKVYSVSESEKSYSGDEIKYLGMPTYDLTIQGICKDNFDEYVDYIKSTNDDDKRVKLDIGSYKFQIIENEGNKKKMEEKVPARELLDVAIACGTAVQEYGRYEESAKRADDKMKKLLEKVDKIDSSAGSGDKRASEDLGKYIKAHMSAFNNLGSFPKLLLSVGNEALGAVKDGDKE